jgi:hypothetical protein
VPSSLGEIEYDGMGVELGRGIAVYRPSCIVLELGRDEASGCLSGVVTTDSRLGIPLQLRERRVDGLAVRLAHTVIASDERGQ